MKKVIVVFLLGILQYVHAQEKIDFIDNDWQKAFTLAKQNNKYVFVDCYTDWCYWCKVMVKETFSKDEVAAAMNKNFVPLKMEMEHNFGKKVAMKYRVNSYPIYLIFNADGKLVYQAGGYMQAPAFLDKLNEALSPSKQIKAPGVSNKVELDFPDFYAKGFDENGKREFPDGNVLLAYFDHQTDLMSEVNFDILARFVGINPDKYQQYFLDNHTKYAELYTAEAVNDIIYSIAFKKLQSAIDDSSEAGLTSTYAFIDKYFDDPKDRAETRGYYGISFYKGTHNWKKFGDEVDKFIALKGYVYDNAINEWSWEVFQKCNDNTVVQKAISWMKPVIETKQQYAYMDTYAALLYKAKRWTDAKTYAQKAIELGKKEGQKTESTEALLKLLEKRQ